jgi:hypothetical protein
MLINSRLNRGEARNYDLIGSWRTVVSRTHISHNRNDIIAVSFLETDFILEVTKTEK